MSHVLNVCRNIPWVANLCWPPPTGTDQQRKFRELYILFLKVNLRSVTEGLGRKVKLGLLEIAGTMNLQIYFFTLITFPTAKCG